MQHKLTLCLILTMTPAAFTGETGAQPQAPDADAEPSSRSTNTGAENAKTTTRGGSGEPSAEAPELDSETRPLPDAWLPQTLVIGTDADRGGRLPRIDPTVSLDREQFEDRPNTRRLGDVINRMPSVFMGGPPGENKDIRLRGMDKEFTRFELDGVQLPGGGEKREFQVNRISPFAVGEIKILRNAPAEFESDGTAGRVQADLREIPEEFRIDFRGSAGGIDAINGEQRRVSLGFGDRPTESFGYNIFFDYQRSPLQKIKSKTKIAPDGSVKETEFEDESKPTDSYNFIAETVFFYDRGELRIKPTFFYLEEDKDKFKRKRKLDKGVTELEFEEEEKIQDTRGIALENEHHFDNGWKLWSQVGYFSTRERKEKTKRKLKDTGSGPQPDKREIEDESKEDEFWQGRSKLTIPFRLVFRQQLKIGIHLRTRDRFRDKRKIEIKPNGDRSNKTKPKDTYSLSEDYFAGFVQDKFWLTDRFTVMPGVRIEAVELDATSGDGTSRSASFLDVNPSLHIRYALSESWAIHGAASRKVNRPKFDEIAPFTEEKGDRFVEGNPELDPARSWNFDLGTTYQTPELLLGINFFHKEVRGVIEEVDTGTDRNGKDVFRVENVGDGWTRGLEFEQRAHLALLHPRLEGLEVWANESVFDSELTEEKTGRTRPFNEQPGWLANFGLDYTFAPTGTTFTVAGKYIDELKKFKKAGEREIEDARLTLDLGIRQRIAEGVQLTFDAINLLDTEKEKTKIKSNGEIERETESTGRLFFVGIEATF